jgi:hypothetical protein
MKVTGRGIAIVLLVSAIIAPLATCAYNVIGYESHARACEDNRGGDFDSDKCRYHWYHGRDAER